MYTLRMREDVWGCQNANCDTSSLCNHFRGESSTGRSAHELQQVLPELLACSIALEIQSQDDLIHLGHL